MKIFDMENDKRVYKLVLTGGKYSIKPQNSSKLSYFKSFPLFSLEKGKKIFSRVSYF